MEVGGKRPGEGGGLLDTVGVPMAAQLLVGLCRDAPEQFVTAAHGARAILKSMQEGALDPAIFLLMNIPDGTEYRDYTNDQLVNMMVNLFKSHPEAGLQVLTIAIPKMTAIASGNPGALPTVEPVPVATQPLIAAPDAARKPIDASPKALAPAKMRVLNSPSAAAENQGPGVVQEVSQKVSGAVAKWWKWMIK